MKLARIALVLLVTVSFLTACENTKSVLGDKRTQGALLGGAIGAGTGAIIGSQTGNTGAGIAIGSGIGALTGALIGHVLEKQEQELKRIEAESYRRDQELQDMIVRRNAETQALVVTLAGDFLFDTDSSTLKPGAYAKLNKIAGVQHAALAAPRGSGEERADPGRRQPDARLAGGLRREPASREREHARRVAAEPACGDRSARWRWRWRGRRGHHAAGAGLLTASGPEGPEGLPPRGGQALFLPAAGARPACLTQGAISP
jgi:uncharacterized protein YcfJ